MKEQEIKKFEEKVSLAEDCGLTYTNSFDEDGKPVFIGKKADFDKFELELKK